jgi:putative membrane protein
MMFFAQLIHGFLPTRATFMLDFVFVAMFAVLPILAFSIRLIKRRQYAWHKRIQIALAIVLLVAVTAFEIDLNFITKNWRPLAEPSPYYASGWVDYSLWIHLMFAVPTPFLWITVIVQALRKFPNPAAPNAHSRQHTRWGWLAAAGMAMTAITGWIFYYLAFVA